MEAKDLFMYLLGISSVGMLLKFVFGFSMMTAGLFAFLGVTFIYLKLHKH